MANETLLTLTGNGVAPYSARGLTQTLDPIQAAGNNRRTINGSLKDLSQAQFQKYTTTISCQDQRAPALDGVWIGQQFTVDCVAELSYKTAGGAPQRTVVPGSSHVDGDYTYYRPRLIMRVAAFTTSRDEYNVDVQWSLQLDEI